MPTTPLKMLKFVSENKCAAQFCSYKSCRYFLSQGFLHAMFFGNDRGRKRAGRERERKLRKRSRINAGQLVAQIWPCRACGNRLTPRSFNVDRSYPNRLRRHGTHPLAKGFEIEKRSLARG
jgi:hypothetical protein